MPRRSRRYVALLITASLLGGAGVAGASTWVVTAVFGSNPAQAQSTVINAPTGGTASSPKSTSLVISWTAPSSGAVPSGYLVKRNGAAVPPGGGCFGVRTTTSCTDSGLVANTTYTYFVVSELVGTNWISSGSNTFTGTTNLTFVVTGITSTNASGNTVGLMGVGDTFAVTFNYPVNSSTINTGAGASTITLVGSSSSANTNITINTLTSASGFGVTSRYESSGNTSTGAGTLSLSNSNQTVTFTVTGSLTNTGNITAGSPSTFTFVPLATIQDTSGDTASTSFSQSPALQIF